MDWNRAAVLFLALKDLLSYSKLLQSEFKSSFNLDCIFALAKRLDFVLKSNIKST